MKVWGVIIALCAVVGLVLMMRFGPPDATDGRSALDVGRASRSSREQLDERGMDASRPLDQPRAAAGTESGRSGAATGHDAGGTGSASDDSRRAKIAQTIRDERARNPASSTIPRSGGPGGGGGGAHSGVGSRVANIPDRAPQAALNDHEVPPADAENQAAEDTAPGEIPEVAYDGADQVFDATSQVEITDAGEIEGNAGTISFWLKPEWEKGNRADANFVQLGDSGLQILKEGNTLRFQYTDSTGNMYGGGADMTDWRAGNWRHVTATWDGAQLALYIDGGQIFLNGSPTPPDIHSNSTLYVGSSFPSGIPSAPAQLSHLTVLNRVASGPEVVQMYESGGGAPKR